MSERIIVIAGPTASGKSGLAMSVARAFDGEIVSADSVQVYRGLDIGSAKATLAEKAEIPHHLLDVADPAERFSAATYAKLADLAIRDIQSRGRLPVVVGGTGLYIRALLYGLAEAAPSDATTRAALEREIEEEGLWALHQRLAEVDPLSAAKIHRNDRIRTVRALEVFELTGIPMSTHHAAHERSTPRFDWAGVALTAPRPWLWSRIERRCYHMANNGLVEEVKALVDAGLDPNAPGLSTIGYSHVVRL